MKKRILAIVLSCAMALTFLAACGGGASSGGASSGGNSGAAKKPEYTLIFGSTYNDDYHYLVQAAEFEKEIEEKSGGRIDVQIYGNGAIVADDRQSVEMLANNQIQFGMADISMFGTVFNDPRYSLASTPYLLGTDLEKIYDLTDTGASYKALWADTAKRGIAVVGAVDGGSATAINTKRAIETMADFKDLKIRTAEADTYVKPMACVGANPTPMSWGEVYTGLQQGTIDGCFSAFAGMYNMGFFDFCKYATPTYAFFFLHTYGFSQQFLDSLPEDLQKVCLEAGANYVARVRVDCATYADDLMNKMVENKVTVSEPSAELLAEMEASMADYIASCKAACPEFADQVSADLAALG